MLSPSERSDNHPFSAPPGEYSLWKRLISLHSVSFVNLLGLTCLGWSNGSLPPFSNHAERQFCVYVLKPTVRLPQVKRTVAISHSRGNPLASWSPVHILIAAMQDYSHVPEVPNKQYYNEPVPVSEYDANLHVRETWHDGRVGYSTTIAHGKF